MLKSLKGRGGTGRQWLPIGGLLLLSLLWALRWVRADLEPGAAAGGGLGPWLNEAALLGSFAAISGIAGAVLKKRWPTGKVAIKSVLVGIGLFFVPAALNAVIQSRIDDVTRVAMFSMTPLFAVIFERHLRTEDERAGEIRGGFLAAMIAVAGTLLVFPVELPRSYGSALALFGVVAAAAVVAAANCVGGEIAQSQGVSRLTLAAVSSGSATLLLCMVGLIWHRNGSSSAGIDAWVLADMVALALLFWLMRRVSAAQMTTRFLIAPLLANVISLAYLRPHVGIQSWIGLALIAAGAGWLVFGQTEARNTETLGLN